MQPTQIDHPRAATLRTVVQVGISSLLILCGLVPEIIGIVLDESGIEGQVRKVMLGVSAALAAVAAILTRVMAIPTVNQWLAETMPSISADGGASRRVDESA